MRSCSAASRFSQHGKRVTPLACEVRTMPAMATLERKLPPSEKLLTGTPPKQLFTVPLPENPFFTGREEVLEGAEEDAGRARHCGVSPGWAGWKRCRRQRSMPTIIARITRAVLWARAESHETLFGRSSLIGRASGVA